MIHNELFRQCLSEVAEDTRRQFEMSFAIAERIDTLLKKKGITQHALAVSLQKRDSEVNKWLSGRHNFTLRTLAKISNVLGEDLITTSN